MAAQGNQLKRSISLSNMEHVGKIHQSIAKDRREGPPEAVCYFDVFTAFSFLLPMNSLKGESLEFSNHLLSGIQDQGMQKRLEDEGVINWTSSCLKLYCLRTKGDGNCLMHAASLAMWGIHDDHMILRLAVHEAMKSGEGSTLYRRWLNARRQEMHQFSASLDKTQKETEWRRVVDMCNPLGYNGRTESLEEFHIFVLANVLRRPVIVYGLHKVRSLASGVTLAPCNIPGIYLPLLWTPDCVAKNPICLGYAGSHFSALVPSDDYNPRYPPAFPLCNKNGLSLPVHFLLEEEEYSAKGCKQDYLMLEEYQGSIGVFEAAQVGIKDQPEFLKSFWGNYVRQSRVSFGSFGGGGFGPGGQTEQRARMGGRQSQEVQRCPICNSLGGGPEKSFLCDDCYSQQLLAVGGPSPPPAHPPRESHIPDEGDASLPAPLTTTAHRDTHKCKMASCDLFGSPQYEGYCSKCYKEVQLAGRDRIGSQTGHRMDTPRPTPCKQCHKYEGVVVYDGLCVDCHSRRVRPQDTPPAAHTGPTLCKQCHAFEGVPVFGGLCSGCHSRNIHPREIPTTTGSDVMGYQHQANIGGGGGGASGNPTPLNQPGRVKYCSHPGCGKVRDPSSEELCFDHFVEQLSNPSSSSGGIRRCTYEGCTKTADPSARILCNDHLMQALDGNLPRFDMSLLMQGGQGHSAREQANRMGGRSASFENGDDLPRPLAAVPKGDPALDYRGRPEGKTVAAPFSQARHMGQEIDRINISGKVSEPSKLRCFVCQELEPEDNPAGVIVCSEHARDLHKMKTGLHRPPKQERSKSTPFIDTRCSAQKRGLVII